MFAGESGFGCLWVVVGAVRGFSLMVGVLSHGAQLLTWLSQLLAVIVD